MAPFPRRQPFRSLSPLNQIAFFQPPRYQEPASPSTDLTSRCGLVAGVTLSKSHFGSKRLAETIGALRRVSEGLPRVPLLACLADWPESPRRSLVSGIRSLPVRAVIPGAPPVPLRELRETLTARTQLVEDVNRWFRTHLALDPGELQAGLAILATGFDASPTDLLPEDAVRQKWGGRPADRGTSWGEESGQPYVCSVSLDGT